MMHLAMVMAKSQFCIGLSDRMQLLGHLAFPQGVPL